MAGIAHSHPSSARRGAARPIPWLARRRTLGWLNVIGGIAVLGSYAHGILTHPETRGEVWGGVPEGLRPLYGISMWLAAAGYLAFTGFVLRGLDPREVRLAGGFGYGAFLPLYALVLIPSALWMPLTFAMLERPDPVLWLAIRGVLALVGLGALGIIAALLTLRDRRPLWAYVPALIGAVCFAFQTAVLDAIVWPAYFPA